MKAKVSQGERELKKLEQEITLLEAEVIKVLMGTSSFEEDVLSRLMQEKKQHQAEVNDTVSYFRYQLAQLELEMEDIDAQYDEMINWSDIFQSADIKTKKKICMQIFKRIEIRRGYELRVELNFAISQFGIDIDCSELTDLVS